MNIFFIFSCILTYDNYTGMTDLQFRELTVRWRAMFDQLMRLRQPVFQNHVPLGPDIYRILTHSFNFLIINLQNYFPSRNGNYNILSGELNRIHAVFTTFQTNCRLLRIPLQ